MGFKQWWDQNNSAVFTGASIVCDLLALFFSITEMPMAVAAVEEAERDKYEEFIQEGGEDEEDFEGLTFFEKIKVGVPKCAKTLICTTGGVGFAIASYATSKNRENQYAQLYSAAAAGSNILYDVVKEKVSRDKFSEINTEVNKRKEDKGYLVRRDTPKKEEMVNNWIETGQSYFIDVFSGQEFSINPDEIQRVVNEINRDRLLGEDLCLNECWYSRLIARGAKGLKTIQLGWNLGWPCCSDEHDLLAVEADPQAMGNYCYRSALTFTIDPKVIYPDKY